MTPALFLAALAGILTFLSVQTFLAATFFVLFYRWRDQQKGPVSLPDITLVRPLEGADTGLLDNLESFLLSPWPGRRQLILCLPNLQDPAAAICAQLQARWPEEDIQIVTSDGGPLWKNRKVRHQLAALPLVKYPILISADADVRLEANTLPVMVGHLLARAETGVVYGATSYRPEGELGSRVLSAILGVGLHSFQALAALSRFTGGIPAMAGPLWCVRREDLERMGGLTRVADHVGDDLGLAEAAHTLGLEVACSPMPIFCYEPDLSYAALTDRMERWIRVLKAHQPHKVHTYPLILASFPLTLVLGGGAYVLGESWVWWMVVVSGLVRFPLGIVLRHLNHQPPRWDWALYAVLGELTLLRAYVRALVGDRLTWRGRTYTIRRGGHMEEIITP